MCECRSAPLGRRWTKLRSKGGRSLWSLNQAAVRSVSAGVALLADVIRHNAASNAAATAGTGLAAPRNSNGCRFIDSSGCVAAKGLSPRRHSGTAAQRHSGTAATSLISTPSSNAIGRRNATSQARNRNVPPVFGGWRWAPAARPTRVNLRPPGCCPALCRYGRSRQRSATAGRLCPVAPGLGRTGHARADRAAPDGD